MGISRSPESPWTAENFACRVPLRQFQARPPVWPRDLRAQWSAGGGAIAGMTTARTLFCLEQLAGDHWMRVVIRAEHSHGHEIAHRLTAAEPMICRMKSALTAQNWPAKMPNALAAYQDDGAPRTTCVIGSKGRHGWAARDEMLVSFVIA